MGWTSLHRDKGVSDRDFFEAEFRGKSKIVASATVKGVFYAAVRNDDDATYKPGETWALVVLLQRGRGHYNFGYKDMSEDMGPGADDCPTAILDLLSLTDNEYATAWRARCRAKRDALASKPKVGAGTRVRFARPLSFNDGAELADFVRVDARSSIFRSVDNGGRYRITNWRQRDYEVIA